MGIHQLPTLQHEADRRPLRVGSHVLRNGVLLAPMSGITDLPFRHCADRLGAGLVVSEMVASEHLLQERRDAHRKANGNGLRPCVVQLAGCEPRWMAEGARMAEESGADIIDINMGCPAREVTGKLSGSALMRDLDHALRLIEAVLAAVNVPVTLKMRTGWDADNRNAPELARRAAAAGVRLLTVHARTRCQFFRGAPDWTFVRNVKDSVRIPVIINGDIVDAATAAAALRASGADGVMIGRAARGAPWLAGRIAAYLASGCDPGPPPLAAQATIAIAHVHAMLAHYGPHRGLRNARKHVGWYLTSSDQTDALVKAWRQQLCTSESPRDVLAGLKTYYRLAGEIAA